MTQSCNCKMYVSCPRNSGKVKAGLHRTTENCRLAGLFDHSLDEFERLGRVGSECVVVRSVSQAFFNRIECLTGSSKNKQEVLLGDRTISRVNEFPPPTN